MSAMVDAVLPSRWVEPWRPVVELRHLWFRQITAQQRNDAACVLRESLMTDARFWEIVSQPSVLGGRRKWPGMLPKGW